MHPYGLWMDSLSPGGMPFTHHLSPWKYSDFPWAKKTLLFLDSTEKEKAPTEHIENDNIYVHHFAELILINNLFMCWIEACIIYR